MKRINGWIPVSILLGIILAGGLTLMGYIFIIGRGYYDSVKVYNLLETVSSDAVVIGAGNTEEYKEIELNRFSVPSSGDISAGSGNKYSLEDHDEEIDVDGENDEKIDDETGDMDKDYILPESNRRKLTADDLEELTPRELSYARNEIYARHGRRFQSNELQEYFDSKEWYEIDDSFDDRDLQGVERANAELIAEYQQANEKMYKVN